MFEKYDYNGGSIVNLMSSISKNFGKRHQYKELNVLRAKELKGFKNIVLIVIDGLGYEYLSKQKDSFLFKHLKVKITSIFLPTTVCANTVFLTGYPPQQHGLTGWDIHLKEVGTITTILRFIPLFGKQSLSDSGFQMNSIMDIPSYYKGLNAKCYNLLDKTFSHSPFSRYTLKGAKIVPTSSYKNLFTKLKQITNKKSTKRKFVQAYIGELDSLTHVKGTKSKAVKKLFSEIDSKIEKFAKAIKGTNTKLIVVADHGFIDTPKEKEIWVEDVKGLKECLTIPISGEPRVRYCFVRPSKVKDFEKIVKTKLSKYCWCYKGEELIKKNVYGLGKPNKKLFDRVGDYVLIMKKNYTMREKLANYKKSKEFSIGKHGGVSEAESTVPLITVDL